MKLRTILVMIWVGFILTKIVYFLIVINMNLVFTKSIIDSNLILIGLGVLCVILSLLLTIKTYTKKGLIHNKFSDLIFKDKWEDREKGYNTRLFNMYVLTLSFGETAAMYGLVGYITNPNIVIFIVLIILSIIPWLFIFPTKNRLIKIDDINLKKGVYIINT